MVMMMLAGDNSCLLHQSSLQSYQQRNLGKVGGMDEGVRILPINI
jgi:hypothetical protein